MAALVLDRSRGRERRGGDDVVVVVGRAGPVRCEMLPLVTELRAEPADAERWLVMLSRVAAPDADQEERRSRQELAREAASSIGASLDVAQTAKTLADLLVPAFADLATVDLAEGVLVGDEPPPLAAAVDVRLRRVASAQSPGVSAESLVRVGEAVPAVPDSDLMRPLMLGNAVVVPDTALLRSDLRVDKEKLSSLIPEEAHSSVAVPLFARGLVLGCLTAWRSRLPTAFGDDDATLLREIAGRAALGVDNARRYTKEHRSAVALQRSLLPQAIGRVAAAETVGTYQPAGGGVGVGGDWFDVIPLPSLRVAFVVGDVVGRGLSATAAMARLRTAVQTLAELDLEPEELLTRLDDLVLGFAAEQDADSDTGSEPAVLGATCLYVVQDPLRERCTVASAGHPPPAVLLPGDEARLMEVAPGPPLGVGGMAFTEFEFALPAGAVLALYTDGLLASRDGDIDEGMELLCRSLSAGGGSDRSLREINEGVFGELLRSPAADDAALLLARVRRLPPSVVAEWQFDADLSVVAHARELAVAQLREWHLDELGFVTELVVSELVTNAVRYAGGPIGLRLIRDQVLVCEVSDPGGTQPRLRRARETDEGGRGLFLVAQLTDRWGSRFTGTGKIIWTEQAIEPGTLAEQ
ncbi:SpoIIE family protein phosphatase [Streptomyces sp. NPDC058466]|uniref:ATP-binding SpoIIE family protein phosphatase n=1 Tax=Streptomyces sp. NPDC058466 TaxID=3346512 RepID=UPI003646BB16